MHEPKATKIALCLGFDARQSLVVVLLDLKSSHLEIVSNFVQGSVPQEFSAKLTSQITFCSRTLTIIDYQPQGR